MARTLEKISQGAKQRQQASQSLNQRGGRGRQQQDNGMPDEVAALCIFGGDRGILQTIFATHPPIEKRIEKLRAR
jgi:Zn-dependent protease with chaperone function